MNKQLLAAIFVLLGLIGVPLMASEQAPQQKQSMKRKFLTVPNIGLAVLFGGGAAFKGFANMFPYEPYIDGFYNHERIARRNGTIMMVAGASGLMYNMLKNVRNSQKTA